MSPLFFNVRLTSVSGAVVEAGELAATSQTSEFRYTSSYLQHRLFTPFAIDPTNLHLHSGSQHFQQSVPGVIEDSLPDQWGRRVMAAAFKLPMHQQSPHVLLSYLDGSQFGALSFKAFNSTAEKHKLTMDTIDSLETLIQSSIEFEQNETLSENALLRLFNAGGSAGGAHPKLSILDHTGTPILVKLASVNDHYDIVGLEASSLQLASLCGMSVPDFEIIKLSKSRRALQLSRFDIPANTQGRYHMISMQSLLNARGFYRCGYRDMAGAIKMVSCDPKEDLKALYLQMVFNAAIGNTDDHLKNFSMMYNGKGYRLTPAYDLLPNVNRAMDHVLVFRDDTITPRYSMLTGELLKSFALSAMEADEIICRICSVIVSNLADVFQQYQVKASDAKFFQDDISRRTKRVSGKA